MSYLKKSQHFMLAIASMLLSACSLQYILEAGINQTQILLSRKDLQDAEQYLDEQELKNLRIASEARNYAKTIGLPVGKTFSSFVVVADEYVSWLLMASERIAFKPKTWCYPIVGKVPYKGFFEKTDAELLSRRLEELGYDTLIRGVPAYSTLGWFDDPLFSNTLRASELSVVNTVFHELFHSALWIPHSPSLNETAAQVFGNSLTMTFSTTCQTCSNSLESESLDHLQRERKFAKMISSMKAELNLIYENPELLNAEKLKLRAQRFSDIVSKWSLPAKRTSFTQVNNAEILQSVIYYREYDLFEKLWENCSRNALCYLETIKKIAVKKNEEENFQSLRDYLYSSS